MNLEIINNTGSEIDEERIADFVSFAYNFLQIPEQYNLSITVVDKKEIQSLNAEWLENDAPTDVLSFPLDYIKEIDSPFLPTKKSHAMKGLNEDDTFADDEKSLGDIVICPEVIYERDEYDKDIATDNFMKIIFIISHSLCHLIGFDHNQDEEEIAMFKLQREIVKNWLLDS